MLPDEKRTCFNWGKEDHRAKDFKLPDRRQQGNNGRALTVGDGQKDVFLGVFVADMPIPRGDFPAPGLTAWRAGEAQGGSKGAHWGQGGRATAQVVQ